MRLKVPLDGRARCFIVRVSHKACIVERRVHIPWAGLDWTGQMGEKFALYGIDTLSETLTLGCLLAVVRICMRAVCGLKSISRR